MSKIVFTTDKYIVKTFSMDNFDDFVKINQDSSVSRYVNHNPNEAPKTFRECLETFSNILATQEKLGYAYWAIYDRQNIFIGQCGVSQNYDKSLNFCYVIHKKYWGRGIGTEIAGMTLKYLFDNFKNIWEIKAMCFAKNKASMRVLEKLGFVVVGETEEFNKILYFLRITREMYEQKEKIS
ncbi:MAG: GNAT family N-acetyltransferase [Rickettsiales bacterium]|jgi:RimJ/RimL family protein N-acetyltransferase|nr:GNAT family N-acetyltransferase [Rickettsiales bacterium]